MRVGNKCIPNKLFISLFIQYVFLRSIYLKSSWLNPGHPKIQFLVSLIPQKIIGINIIKFVRKEFSEMVAR